MQNEPLDLMRELKIPDFDCAEVDEQDSNVDGGGVSSTTLTKGLHGLPLLISPATVTGDAPQKASLQCKAVATEIVDPELESLLDDLELQEKVSELREKSSNGSMIQVSTTATVGGGIKGKSSSRTLMCGYSRLREDIVDTMKKDDE